MSRALAVVALPFYAVGIAVQVCVAAYRMARLEARLQRYAKDEAELHRADVRAELAKHRQRLANERRWGTN
jgi:hypothetical protein